MASGNTVTLTFAGDSSSLEKSFKDVGSKAVSMAADFDKAEAKSKSFGSAMDGVGSSVGGAEGKFMGTADLLDGLGGAFGLPTEGATGLMRAFGDLSGGFEVVSGLFTSGIGQLGKFATSIGLTSAATSVWTGIQTAFNAVMAMNPIGLTVVGLVALGAALVVAYNKSETFRNIVQSAFGTVKNVVGDLVGVFQSVGSAIGGAFTGGIGIAKGAINGLIGMIESGLNIIMTPYRMSAGFLNKIPGVGSAVPDFMTHDIRLPRLHTGGVVPGPAGAEVPILAMAGETVTPAGAAAGGTQVIQLVLDGRVVAEVVRNNLLALQKRTPLGFVS